MQNEGKTGPAKRQRKVSSEELAAMETRLPGLHGDCIKL